MFVAAFATDEGEVIGDVAATSKDSIFSTALVALHCPVGDGAESAVELAVDPAKFRDAIAADLPAEQTAVLAATTPPPPLGTVTHFDAVRDDSDTSVPSEKEKGS